MYCFFFLLSFSLLLSGNFKSENGTIEPKENVGLCVFVLQEDESFYEWKRENYHYIPIKIQIATVNVSSFDDDIDDSFTGIFARGIDEPSFA